MRPLLNAAMTTSQAAFSSSRTAFTSSRRPLCRVASSAGYFSFNRATVESDTGAPSPGNRARDRRSSARAPPRPPWSLACKQRQRPALKARFTVAHPRPPHCDSPTSQGQAPGLAIAASIAGMGIHRRTSLQFSSLQKLRDFVLQHTLNHPLHPTEHPFFQHVPHRS